MTFTIQNLTTSEKETSVIVREIRDTELMTSDEVLMLEAFNVAFGSI
jgi:hypothetical protein